MSILIGFLTAIHVLVAILLIVLVLMQKSKDQGVGAAFGGAVTETVFGAGTTSALVRMTVWCAGLLLATSLALAVIHARVHPTGESELDRQIKTAPAAPAGGASALPLAPTAPSQAPATSETPKPAPAPATPATPAAPAQP